MIRTATVEDLPRIIELGKMLHSESAEYRDIPYDPDKVAETMIDAIENRGVVFVYERDGAIRGGVAGVITEYWFSREKIAGDYSVFVEPAYRNGMIAVRLVLAFKAWASLSGARQVKMGVTTGIAGAERLYQSLGMRHCGNLFVEDLNNGN